MEKEEEGSEKEKHWKDENDDKKKKTYGYSKVTLHNLGSHNRRRHRHRRRCRLRSGKVEKDTESFWSFW